MMGTTVSILLLLTLTRGMNRRCRSVDNLFQLSPCIYSTTSCNAPPAPLLSSMANEQPSVLARNFKALNIEFQNGDDRITAEEIEEDIEGEQGTIPDLVADDLEPSTQEFMKKWKQTVFGASRGVTDKTESEYQR
jgi:hypothetical protein